jgi:hypothetical protein
MLSLGSRSAANTDAMNRVFAGICQVWRVSHHRRDTDPPSPRGRALSQCSDQWTRMAYLSGSVHINGRRILGTSATVHTWVCGCGPSIPTIQRKVWRFLIFHLRDRFESIHVCLSTARDWLIGGTSSVFLRLAKIMGRDAR